MIVEMVLIEEEEEEDRLNWIRFWEKCKIVKYFLHVKNG